MYVPTYLMFQMKVKAFGVEHQLNLILAEPEVSADMVPEIRVVIKPHRTCLPHAHLLRLQPTLPP